MASDLAQLQRELERRRRESERLAQMQQRFNEALLDEIRYRVREATRVEEPPGAVSPGIQRAEEIVSALTSPIRAFMQTPVGQFIERSAQVAGPTLLFQPPMPEATTGYPAADVAAEILGQLAGSLGQFALAQGVSGAALQALGRVPQLARLAEIAPTALQAAGRGAAAGATLSGLQAAFAPPEARPTLQEALQNIAFMGGAGAAGPLTQQFLRTRFPGIPAVAEAALTGAAAGTAGALAAAPFGDHESVPDFLRDLAVDAAALALLHGTMAAFRPPRPEQEFIRHMRRTAEELERAQRAAAAGDEAAVRAAYRRYWENINSAYHFGVQAGQREVGTRLPAEAAIRFDLAFLRATQRQMRNVTPERPLVPGISPGMAQQVMEYARARAPENVTVEDLMRRFNMSRQQAQRAYEQIIQTHEITPAAPASAEPTPTPTPRAEGEAAPMVPPHPYQAALEILDQLRAEGRTIRRPAAPPQETPTHPRIEQFQRRLEAAERARQAPPQPSPIEQIRQRLEARTQPVQPTERQLEVLPGPYQVIRSTRGEGWEVVNTDTQELVTQAPVANYFEAEEQAMRLNEALPEPTRQLQGGYLPGQRVRDRRGRVLTVIDNAGPNLLMAQAADGSRVRVHLRAIEPVDEPIRPPVEPDVIEVEAEPVEATPPPAPTAPAQQVAPPSPPAEPVPPPTPPAEEVAPPTPRRIERTVERLTDVQPGEVVYDPRGNALTVVDTRDPSLLTVRNERGTIFRIGRRVVRLEPPEGIRPVETASPEAPERAAEAPQVQSPMEAATPPSEAAVLRQAASPQVEAPAETPPSTLRPTPAAVAQPVATGGRSTAATERGTEVETEWAIVEARDLITSHDTRLRPDPRFPQELQPRDRARAASELQITRMVNQLRPEFLGESPKASEGAPIVGPDMIVESGNARTIALKRAYEQSPEAAERYRQFLMENAERFGLDPEAIRQAEAPVLVRVRRTDVDRRQFVVEANEGAVAAMSATEQAMADAERMSEGLMSLFQPSEDGEIVTAANREFISQFVQGIVSPADRGRVIDERGNLSQEGVTRIRNAVFAKAYGDPGALSILAESTDSNVRNITGGMLIAAPRIAQLRDRIRRGELFDLDPARDIAAAMRKLSELRSQGTPVDVYLQQQQMFPDELSDLARDFLAVFDANKRSRKRIADILRTYVDIVEALGDPRQETLFESRPIPQPQNVLQAAIEKVNEGYEPRTGQTTLFESESVRSALAEGETRPLAQEPGRPRDALGLPAAAAEPAAAEPGAPKPVAHERPPASQDRPERVVTRKEVIDYIEREFMMPIRVGRMRLRGARGEFNLKTHVTRIRRAEDFRAITHEFGHFLSETIPLHPENYPELQPLGAALYPNADPMLQREEGNAEFFYLYLSQPDAAKAAAPSYYADFEELLAREPELGRRVKELQRMSVQLFNQTGTAAVKAMIVREEAKAVPFLTPLQRFYTTWVDDLHPIWVVMKYVLGEENIRSEWDVRLSQNPYILGRLARGRFRKAHALLTRSQISPDFRNVGPSYREILRPVAHVIEDFEAYLVAKRAVELWDRGINPGVSLEDARAAVQELERPEFVQAQRQLLGYQNLLIDHLVDAGVISRQTADAFRRLNEYYVPFYRYFGEETVSGGMAGSRLRWGDLPQPVKAIRGSTRSIYSPLHSIIRNTYVMIDVAERNRAATAFYNLVKDKEGIGWLVEEVPTPMQPNQVELERLRKDLIDAGVPAEVLDQADLERVAVVFNPVRHARWKEKQENILTVYVDGKPRFLKLHPELYRAFQFMDQPSFNFLFQLLAFPTRLLRAGATLNLDFSARNPFRDQFSALMNRKYRFWPFIDPARAMMAAIRGNIGKGDELYDKWIASGGAQSTMVSLNRDYLEKDLRKMLGQYTAGERALQVIRSGITALEFISSVLEESTRLAQFRAGLRAEGETEEGIRRAAYASREISVDFQRAGTWGREANKIKAFFNAAIQSPDQVARLWRRDPIGYTLRGFMFITTISVALYLRNRNDPRYWELPQWRRDLFWVFLGEDEIHFLPKPFELGVIFGTLPERILQWVMENDPEAFDEFANTFLEATLPIDPTNPVDWLPDALTPIVEVYANRRIFSGTPIVPRGEQDLLPPLQYGPYTSEFAKALGRYTGTSPRQIEHLITGYGAGLARHALRFLDRLAGVERPAPIIRPFGGDPFEDSASIDEFYEELAELERLSRSASELRRRGLPVDIQVNEARLRYMRRVRDDLAQLRRLSRSVIDNRDLSVEQKRQMLRDINLRMINLARRALGKPPITLQQQ